MDIKYAKVVVGGSPISKSNFKLHNMNGRAILPYNSGKYHDRYAIYEEQIALEARAQNPGRIIDESVIAVLKVYYKSEKRHPDTTNISKSIFDGIEKSGLIVNDAQIRKLIIEEFYDKENPRFELELFAESSYELNYDIKRRSESISSVKYLPPSNKKTNYSKKSCSEKNNSKNVGQDCCVICGKSIDKLNKNDFISADKGNTLLCRDCFNKSF